MFRKIITYLTIYSFMFSNVCWAAMITPDGRTQTTVNVNGHVYDVTTSTVSGKNAFNSFSNFDVYKGTTVNLYLPGSTLNLINLVRDGKTNIDGILNSIKNGKIGGNVFILNPHGIAIGKSGVVNVGSLMLSTPNKEFMDQVIGQDGSISELATCRSIRPASFPSKAKSKRLIRLRSGPAAWLTPARFWPTSNRRRLPTSLIPAVLTLTRRLLSKTAKSAFLPKTTWLMPGRSKPMRAAAAKPAASLSKPAAISACGKAR